MALTTEESARLTRLREARDLLASGQAVEEVRSGGRAKRYQAGDLGSLDGQIAALEAKTTATGRLRGALTFRFR